MLPSRNQLGVVHNPYQGAHKKVLCVCSAGCLRSPTAAHILSSPPFNFNTRAVGTSKEYAIIPITNALIMWADIILVMDEHQQCFVNEMQNQLATECNNSYMGDYDYKLVVNLEIPDEYDYRNPNLVELMTNKFWDLFKDEDCLKISVD